ncbi:MAG: histidine kinase, partial [Dermatophilaceae bacterium]
MFSTYTALSLAAPTMIATVLGLIDHPTATWVWLAVALGVVLIAVQQISWLAGSDAWPVGALTWLRLPPVFVRVPALASGVVVGIGIEVYGLSAGRPAYLWAVPAAAALGVLTLAVTRWDREMPRWSHRAVGLVLALAIATAAVGEWASRNSTRADVTGGTTALAVTVVSALVLTVQVGQVWWHRVVTELSTARESLVAWTRMEERLRFAGELHDLQGHELQVIMLRADVGATTLRVNGAEAIEEAVATFKEIRDAAQDTLGQTRAIAHGYRKARFAQEVANTARILGAAGIRTEVTGPVEQIDGDAAHLAGMMVREATTNVLRHSLADTVQITIDQAASGFAVAVLDLGPRRERSDLGSSTGSGSGLASLAERAQRL